MIFGYAVFNDEVDFFADDIVIRGEVEIAEDKVDPLGNTGFFKANTLRVESVHLHSGTVPEGSGITARNIQIEARDRIEVHGWLRAANEIAVNAGSGYFEESVYVTGLIQAGYWRSDWQSPGYGETILEEARISVDSLDDFRISGTIWTYGDNATIDLSTGARFRQETGWIHAWGGNSITSRTSISIEAAERAYINGRVYAGLDEYMEAVLARDVTFTVTLGDGVTRAITIKREETLTNQYIEDLAAVVQSALDAAGLSQITVEVYTGKLKFSSDNKFTFDGGDNGELLGIYPQEVTSFRADNHFEYIAHTNYHYTGWGTNIAVSVGRMVSVGGFMAAADEMVFKAGSDESDVSIFIGGTLYSLAEDSAILLDAKDDLQIFGNVTAAGANSDILSKSLGQVYIDGWLRAGDQIVVRGGTHDSGLSVAFTETGCVVSGDPNNNMDARRDADNPYMQPNGIESPHEVDMYGNGRVDIIGVVKAMGYGADLRIEGAARVLIDSAVEANDQLWVEGGHD